MQNIYLNIRLVIPIADDYLNHKFLQTNLKPHLTLMIYI